MTHQYIIFKGGIKMAYAGAYKAKDESYFKELLLNCIPTEPTHTNSKKLAEYIGLNARDVRLLIQKLRDDGYPICATPEKGYWMARTSWDMADTMSKLKAHIKNSIDTYNSLVESQNALKRKEGNNEYTELLV